MGCPRRKTVNRLFLSSKVLFVSGLFAFCCEEVFCVYFGLYLPAVLQPTAVTYRLTSLHFGTSAFENSQLQFFVSFYAY